MNSYFRLILSDLMQNNFLAGLQKLYDEMFISVPVISVALYMGALFASSLNRKVNASIYAPMFQGSILPVTAVF
jgi:hypothetical protein